VSDVDVVFAGEVFCDLVFGGVPRLPSPGAEVYAECFRVTAGGTATRGVAAARLGLRTGLFAVIGADMFGDQVAAQLNDEPNLDLRWLRHDPAVRTAVTVAVANQHDRAFITYEHESARRPTTWDGPLPTTKALHLGIAGPLPGWAGELRSRGTLVVGGVGWDATGKWSSDLLRRLDEVDVFVLNAVEATQYTRTGSVDAAAKQLADLVAHVVVTDGGAGAVSVDSAAGELIRVPAPDVQVMDPTGAGDVFTAALIHGLLRPDWPSATAVRFAAICGALSVRTLGGASSAPGWPTILDFLATMPDVPAADRALIESSATG
jgi:sugar/nucleoside kinase (ribokinase family)